MTWSMSSQTPAFVGWRLVAQDIRTEGGRHEGNAAEVPVRAVGDADGCRGVLRPVHESHEDFGSDQINLVVHTGYTYSFPPVVGLARLPAELPGRVGRHFKMFAI